MGYLQSQKAVSLGDENTDALFKLHTSNRKSANMFGIKSELLNPSELSAVGSYSNDICPNRQSSSSTAADTSPSTNASNTNISFPEQEHKDELFMNVEPKGVGSSMDNHAITIHHSTGNGLLRSSFDHDYRQKNSPRNSIHRLSNISIGNNPIDFESSQQNNPSSLNTSSHHRTSSISNSKSFGTSLSYYNRSSKPSDWNQQNNGGHLSGVISITQDVSSVPLQSSVFSSGNHAYHASMAPKRSGSWRHTNFHSTSHPRAASIGNKSGIPPVPTIPPNIGHSTDHQHPKANISGSLTKSSSESKNLSTIQSPLKTSNSFFKELSPHSQITLSNVKNNHSHVGSQTKSHSFATPSVFDNNKPVSSDNHNNTTTSSQVHPDSRNPDPKAAPKAVSQKTNVDGHRNHEAKHGNTVQNESKSQKSSNKEGRSSRGGFFSRLSFSRSSSRMKKGSKAKHEDAPDVPAIPHAYIADSSTKSSYRNGKKTPTRTKSRMQQFINWFKPSKERSSNGNSDSASPPPVPRLSITRSQVSREPEKPEEIPSVPPLPSNFKDKGHVPQQRSVSYTPKRSSDTSESLQPSLSFASSNVLSEPFDRKVADLAMKAINSKRINKLLDDAKVMQSLLDRACIITPVRNTEVQLINTAPLTEYEQDEINNYDNIYFTGLRNVDKRRSADENTSSNFGFDDERGDYKVVLGDHIAYRYEVVDFLGKGSFGQVLRCIDYETGKLVALKIIRNKKRFHMQALVETKILQKIREWDPLDEYCMVQYTDHFYFRDHLCVATELLGKNLYELIKSNGFKGLPIVVIKSITRQLIQCLTLLNEKHVIHCDLKPENILLCHPFKSQVKVIDFGSSCFEGECVYTYIQSRFYRSPEVILGMGYGTPIDVWSLGCIIAEMYTGFPLFPGENEQEQLACIMEIFGPPDHSLIDKCSRKKVFFDSSGKPRPFVSSKGVSRRPFSKSLHQVLQCKDVSFLSFISDCLKWDPDERMTPQQAAQHDFLTGKQDVRRPNTAPARQKFARPPNIETAPIPRPLPNLPMEYNDHTLPSPKEPSNQASNLVRSSDKFPNLLTNLDYSIISDNGFLRKPVEKSRP
ncbi:DYRK family cell polarity protein kinase Pom1 [Schizosaccharomyces pombe]|uniref:DYRK-family kinase pom1 n=1 Tax=Schizosaccharomyces pombe (strain 972 / ATCC 24843) TaxID=284812 RepID=POM1_SCHPO|nr:DYRK family protein kinase Pom1 [Schizosaccharomyces pombe]Q09690.1 RecName: Full=DYRK-family kinase pom1 [Schizosaccharomyces pombe 972h-]CAA90490.1 DYRK family protein kinase Pom1 [Schizosaccharomyces pombe]|eukprot:NP_592974.1 DYRK family protein kinase Pom1 [Schizosaccharomyces pombe]